MYLNSNKLALYFSSVFALLSYSALSIAASDIELIEQQNSQIIQQQNQSLENDKNTLEKNREWLILPGAESVSPEGSKTNHNDHCFDIVTIQVSGVTAIKLKRIQRITDAYINQCLGLSQINEILQSISSLYMEKGFVTTRAYLPQQNLTTGTLEIKVIEGRLEAINADPDTKIRAFNAFPGMLNETLNLRDIEQGIEQLNRLSANQVWMDLLPGTEQGDTEVKIYNNPQRRWQGNVRIDNSGQPSTGEYQVRVNVSTDHLLRMNDYTSLTYQTDMEKNSSGKKSESFSMHFDVPYGYWLFSFDSNFYNYKNRVQGESATFDTSGESNQQTVTASRVLYRGQTGKTEWINSLTRKANKNFIEEAKLDTSSRNLAVGKIQLRHSEVLPNNQLVQGSIGYKKGLDMFGSPSKSATQGSPDPRYQAIVGDLSYRKSLKILGLPSSVSSSLSIQHSDDVLFGSEQIGVGGLYSVRGFDGESVSGRSGAYIRNDISWTHSIANNFLKIHSISPTFAWDIGGVFNEPNSTQEKEILQGVSASLRLGGEHISADVTLAHALSRPDDFQDDRNKIHFSVTFKR